MKGKVLLFLLIIITIVIKAQEPELQIEGDFDFKDLEAQYLTLDKIRIKTGLLREKAILYFVDFNRFTGSKNSDTADYYMFRQIYLELKNSAVRQNAIDTDIFSKLPKNTDFYPIVILNYKYNEIRPDAFDKELIIEKNGKLYDTKKTQSPYLEKQIITAAIPVVKFREKNIKFKFSNGFYFTNTQEKISYLEIDFDDGNGFNRYYPADLISVNYPSGGKKIIKFKIFTEDGNIYYANFLANISDYEPPKPDIKEYEITSSTSYWDWYDTGNPNDINGAYGKAKVSIWYAPGHDTLIKPFILLDGFDPFINNEYNRQSRGYKQLYRDLNQVGTLDSLQKCFGYDIVVVDWVGGADWIQKNALTLVDVLNWINSIKVGYYKNIIIGPSMGGQIARWGLAYMEQHNIDHQVSIYISWDSPHRGANIPLGMQFWINKAKDSDVGAMIMYNALMSPAARQLLIYHFNSCTPIDDDDNRYNLGHDQLRDNYSAELQRFGFPRKPTLIGVANGSNSGHSQNNANGELLEPKDRLFKFQTTDADGNPVVIKTYALPAQTDDWSPITKINVYGIRVYTVKVRYTQPYDGAPGGIYPHLQEQLGSLEGMTLDHPFVDFIPTISALDLSHSIDDPFYHPITKTQTPFDYIFYAPAIPSDCYDPEYQPLGDKAYNQLHSSITCELRDNLFALVKGNLEDYLLIQNDILFPGHVNGTVDIRAKNYIRAGRNVDPNTPQGDVIVRAGNHVQFIAGNQIILEPGFEAGPGFEAFIEPENYDCIDGENYYNNFQQDFVQDEYAYNFTEIKEKEDEKPLENYFEIYPNPTQTELNIEYQVPQETLVEISVYNIQGIKVKQISVSEKTAGYYRQTINISDLPAGIYSIVFKTSEKIISKEFIKQ